MNSSPVEEDGISAILDDPKNIDWVLKKKSGNDKESKSINEGGKEVNAILDDPETIDWISKNTSGKGKWGNAVDAILDDPETIDWIGKKKANKPNAELLMGYPKTTHPVDPQAILKKGYSRVLGYTDGGMDQEHGEANGLQPRTGSGAESELLGQPSLQRQRRTQQASLPGAFHLDGPGGGQEGPDPEAASQEIIPDTHEPHGIQGLGGNSDLAVARMVDEDAADMPCAEPSQAQTRSQLKPGSLMLGCSAVLVLITLVGVFALTSGGKEDIDSEVLLLSSSPSHTPSLAPSSQESYLLSLLPGYTVDSIQDPESSQARAFQWMKEDLEQSPFLSPNRIVQRFGLVCFYFSTGGEMWSNKNLWLNHTVHECDWYNGNDFAGKKLLNENLGLIGYLSEFFPPSEPEPRRCEDGSGLIQHMWLDANNLIGTMPPELGLLSSLQTISLGLKNKLQGTLPSQFVGRKSSVRQP